LSSLLFLLLVDSINNLLKEMDLAYLKGINIVEDFIIFHVLFVDIILIVGVGYFKESRVIDSILKLLGSTTWMIINPDNSIGDSS
jgi:hypothetical protein